MRSIGKIKIKKLKRIVKEEFDSMQSYTMNGYQIKEAIKNCVPDEWFATWEGAWAEIERTIIDELLYLQYGRK